MMHGSFDFCLENAILKVIQLGLHAGIQVLSDSSSFYTANCTSDIFAAYFLILADFDVKPATNCLLTHLDRLYSFTKKGNYDFYITDEEKAKLKNIPKNFRKKKFIKKELFECKVSMSSCCQA
jgi:hypothetical protein